MKTKNILFMMLAIASIGTTSLASAEEKSAPQKQANYVMLKAGVYSPSESFDLSNFNGGMPTHLDSKTGFAGEVAIGHYFIPMVALELGAGYFESKGSPAAEPGEAKLKVVPIIATAKVFLPIGIFEPYGLAGIGAYITELDLDGNTSSFSGSSEVTYGLHAGVGLNVNFTKNMFAGFEAKYLWAEPSFGGQHIELDGFVTTADIGFRF